MRELFLVFVGGGAGSLVRYLMGRSMNNLFHQHFPVGTLAVNIVACLILGYVVGLTDHRQLISPAARIFWTVGFCGGFSTFSTFSAETITLIQDGFYLSAVLYIVLSLLFCIGATLGGIYWGGHS